MNFRDDVAAIVSQALATLQIEKDVDQLCSLLEVPKDSSLGDWAFPCFLLARELRKAPPAIAKELANAASALVERSEKVAHVQATGPYVNFSVSKTALAADLMPRILAGALTERRPRVGERVVVEYSQPNTHKAFHVGHCRCASLGDSLGRILEWQGLEVIPVNYLGDEGTHVAKCLWYLMRHFDGEIPERNRGEFLGGLYQRATDLLDLSLLTRAPLPGVRVARVRAIQPPPGDQKWRIVEVESIDGARQVVCGATGFSVGDLVPYAAPGVTVNDKTVTAIEKDGVRSEGMILSQRELGVSDDHANTFVFETNTQIGAEVAELLRIPDALPADQSVLATIAQRQREVSEVLQKLEAREPQVHELWAKTKQWSMDEYYAVYDWLNCRFDHYFFESEVGEEGKRITREYLEKGVFVESEGAIGADLRAHKLGFCILIKRDGTATYAARDLALAQRKFEQYQADRSLYVVDSAQTLHFQQVFKCLELMGYQQVAKCRHVAYAQVIRPDGKMSSRKGNVILFSQLTERLTQKITSEFLEKYRGEWSDEEIADTAYKIALATVRYGMLNTDNNSLIVFDLDQWTARTGNTGPYMMYAYARMQSILREVGQTDPALRDWSLLTHESESDLLLHLSTYPSVVARAAEEMKPLEICVFVYELAKRFSRWYQQCSVLNAESESLRATRAGLVEAVAKVLAHGLELLGIKPVQRM